MTLQTIRHQNLLRAPLLKAEMDNVLSKINPLSQTNAALKQWVYLIDEHEKDSLTIGLVENDPAKSVLIYVRTNSEADLLADKLNRAGIIAESVHGNKSERTKIKTLANFRNQSTSVLVATESATSLIIIEAQMIINSDLPLSAETYGKRVTRHIADKTLNAFISFCDVHEQSRLDNINRAFPGAIQLMEHRIG